MTLRIGRLPILAAGMVSMAVGIWLGLVRLGWALALPWPDQLVAHGPLMVCGFLGTLIGLERAVALGKRWAYLAPILTAAGGVALDTGRIGAPAAWLIAAGSIVVVAVFVVICRRQPSLFALTMAAGAVAWAAGNLQWAAGAAVYRVVFWWMAFLVLTIAGERLELNRVLQPTPTVRWSFVGAMTLVAGGSILTVWRPDAGVRLLGAGLLASTAWLARNDVARRTITQRGVTRFMAVALLGGYAWLGVGGAMGVILAPSTPGVRYDAMLHAVFLGFVMSMVFAHAPVIFPAVLGVSFRFRPTFYAQVAVLHISLILRLVGDLVDVLGRWRVWGGLLNAAAVVLFLVNTVTSLEAAPRLRQKRIVSST
jgi:hypothetical protein